MSVSAEYLLRCAAETGFRAGTLERVVRLAELAAEITRHPRLGAALILKGGTPLNLGFGPPRRLSVDLGYDVRASADAFAGRKLTLRYRSAFGPADLLQVDINYLHRLPLDEPMPLPL